jgi:2-amino-4-hydroxy-6-hydroxymethyldihydropteridine diphosphokinase
VGTQSYLIALGGNQWGKWGSPRVTLDKWGLSLFSGKVSNSPTAFISKDRDSPHLSALLGLVAMSPVLTTAPLGPGKRSYANAVAVIETDLDPLALLAHLKSIERAHGRRAGRRWGDRPLDLDIVGWSGGIWASRTLSIPHPAFRVRRFVLAPLVEIAPDWRDPVTNLTARQLLARLDRRRPRS